MIALSKITDNKYQVIFSENNKFLGMFERDIDGYFYFSEDSRSKGFWSSYVLREIADKLDEINRDWDEQIKKLEDE